MRDTPEDGFSVLDGVAVVAGAAVASVHLRGAFGEAFFGPGWVVTLGTFLWVGTTAAGPFLYFVRRYARKLAGHPRIGDRLWAVMGLPWLLSALIQTWMTRAGEPIGTNPGSTTAMILLVGIGIASLTALAVVWVTWVMVDPKQASATFAGPWTNRVGLVLAIAWPIQCGLGMVVVG